MELYELAFACHIYAGMSDYDRSLAELHQSTGSKIDLTDEAQRYSVLKWLNSWGCRQLSKKYHSIASQSLESWFQEFADSLPSPVKQLSGYDRDDITASAEAYFDLAERIGAFRERTQGNVEVKIGPTAASKILYVLRPNGLPPWDEAIRTHLALDKSEDSYKMYLTEMRQIAENLSRKAQEVGLTESDISHLVGRPQSSIVKLIDEFHWVTISQSLRVPSASELKSWLNMKK